MSSILKDSVSMSKDLTRGAKRSFKPFLRLSVFGLVTIVAIVAAWGVVFNVLGFFATSDLFKKPTAAPIAKVDPTIARAQIQATATAIVIQQAQISDQATVAAIQIQATAASVKIQGQATATAIQIEQAQTNAAASRQQADAPFWDNAGKAVFWAVFALFLLGTTSAIAMMVMREGHRRKLDLLDATSRINTLNPTEQGNYPVRITPTGFIQPAAGNILQPVPTSFNYAPHLMFKDSPQSLQAAGAQPAGLLTAPATAELQLPEKLDLTALLKQVQPDHNRLEIVLGQSKSGPIIRPYGEETLHFGVIGATGSGKSSQAQAIMFQLALADPAARRINFGFLDLEGKTSKPFKDAPHTMFIADDSEMCATALQELENTMDRRARFSEAELENEIIYAIVLEEFLDLRDELDKESWQRVIRLARKGRKSKIYLLCANQTFYSDDDTKIIKGQLRTRSLFAVEDRGTGNAFGYRDNQAIDELARAGIPGRFLFRSPMGLVLAQAPYIAPEAIAAHFTSPSRTTKGQVIEAEYRPIEPIDNRQPQPITRQTGYYFERNQQTDRQQNYHFERERNAAETTTRQADTMPKEPQGELAQVVQLYKQGATSSRLMAAALNCGKDRANNLLNQARTSGLI